MFVSEKSFKEEIPILNIERFEIGDWWMEEALPIDFKRFLDYENLVLEVGFGYGEFLIALSQQREKDLFIGIERLREGLKRLIKGIKEKGLKNIVPLCGDAYVILQVCFDEHTLSEIYVNFPDPWPKKKHIRRRILSEEFFRLSSRKLKSDGKIFFATDDEDYALFAEKEIKKVSSLKNLLEPERFLDISPYPVETRYESKWKKENKRLYYFIYGREDATYKT